MKRACATPLRAAARRWSPSSAARPVGYINVYWTPLAGPLADMPEIVDFGVLARVRRRASAPR